MDPIEQRVRASLRARAEDAEPTPHLYRGVQERISRRQRLRVGAWSVAGLAAVAAAAVIVPNLVSGLEQGTPEVADTPDPVETVEAPAAPGEPEHALLGLTDGSLAMTDLATGDRRELWRAPEGQTVTSVSAAPGARSDDYLAVAATSGGDEQGALVTLFWDDEQLTGARPTPATDLPGGTGQTPAIAISPDGAWLAYTGVSQTVDAAQAVYTVPILRDEDGTYGLATQDAQEVYAVTSGDTSDALEGLVQWTGPTGAPDDESSLSFTSGSGNGAFTLRRTTDGFAPAERTAFDGVSRDALDFSSDFTEAEAATSSGTDAAGFVLTRGAEPGDLELRYGSEVTTFEDIVPEGPYAPEAQLDARGRTALVIAGGDASALRFAGDGGSMTPLGDGVVAGGLLGGEAPEPAEESAPEVDEQGDEPPAAGPLGAGLVVADDTTVTLVGADGSHQELVTFPAEGESTVVDVAVRPGSTETDLTVAITTRAEGGFDVRWLRVVDGEVDTDIDPLGTSFPAPPIEGAGDFPVAPPDLGDGGEMSAAWSPDGDLLAVLSRPGPAEPNQIRTIGWHDDGPSDDPNLAAMFELDSDRPLTLRGWSWSDDGEGADGEAREGVLFLRDELAREAFTTRLDRQGDGAPAMPNADPLERVPGTPAGEVLDIGDADRDGAFETLLVVGDRFPVIEWLPFGTRGEPGMAVAVEATGPRDVSFVETSEQVLLVVLDPAQPMLVDRETEDVAPAPIDGEVVSASLLR